MTLVRRILKLAAASLALVTYVWIDGVRNVPAVKRRKAERRRIRRAHQG